MTVVSKSHRIWTLAACAVQLSQQSFNVTRMHTNWPVCGLSSGNTLLDHAPQLIEQGPAIVINDTAPGGAGLGGGGMTVEAALALLRKLAQQSGMGMPPQADDIFTVPSSEQDRTGGVSRTLPQPVPRDPSGPIRVGGAPPQPAAPVIQPPSVRPGQETGEGPRQGGDPDERFKFVDGPQSFQPDPFEDVRGPRSYR